jgi:hypothetical protein
MSYEFEPASLNYIRKGGTYPKIEILLLLQRFQKY